MAMTPIDQEQRHSAAMIAAISARWAAVAPTAVPQLTALAASALLYAVGAAGDGNPDAWVWGFLALAFAGLRIATATTDLVPSTYALDAIGVTVFIGGTGNASSPFLALALAGAWWAGQKAGRGRLYGLAFVAAYLVLVASQAARAGEMAAVIYQPAFVCAIGIFVDRLRATTNPAGWASTILDGKTYEQQRSSVKAGLSRAVGGGLVPIDVLLTAGQLGLTATQTELIPYLMLGLSNLEIADALSVSEATVRYRLTRLYRSLGVRGRKAAAERARELGLGALVPSTAPNHP